MKNKIIVTIAFLILSISMSYAQTHSIYQNDKIVLGAMRFNKYVKKLKGKRVGMVVNQTSILGENNTHLVDTLLKQGVKIEKIYAPEHGFRGEADAGEHVDNMKDVKTGIQIISIYGSNRKPSKEDLKNIDVLIYDIQDVGVRFYTYIGTLEYVMEAAAENNIPVIVLDRPNPNGHYVDGTILEKQHRSFVGMQPVPIVHGMTVGEYATMLNKEGMLANKVKADLCVIKCEKYDHTTFYELPVRPSPNLPNMRSIYLYAAVCFFEGTDVSVGRGTEKQFQVYGSPNYPKDKAEFEFTPKPNFGSKQPFLQDKLCYGFDLSYLKPENLQKEKQINIKYLLNFYKDFEKKETFFLKNNFFEKLAGTSILRQQIIEGKSEAEIRASWQTGLDNFKKIRKKYLLYADFK
jgi:uncharacterized protein YbbC (DUF1343 family)